MTISQQLQALLKIYQIFMPLNGVICLVPPLITFQRIPRIFLLHHQSLPLCCLFRSRLPILHLPFHFLLQILLQAPPQFLMPQALLFPVSLVLLLILDRRRFRNLLTMIHKPCLHHLCVLQRALSLPCHLRLQVHLLDLCLLPRLHPLLFLLPFASFRISTTLIKLTPIFKAVPKENVAILITLLLQLLKKVK